MDADISTVQSSLNKDGMEMEEEQGSNDMIAVKIKEHQQKVLDSINLSGLKPEERREVQQLIKREVDVFSVVGSDIGSITLTEMQIKLQDKIPVQLNYDTVPKPLHAGLKAYTENLHSKGSITNSSSSHSSPVVSMRKKDSSLGLCCDYQLKTEKPSHTDTLCLKYKIYWKI